MAKGSRGSKQMVKRMARRTTLSAADIKQTSEMKFNITGQVKDSNMGPASERRV